MKTDKLNKWLEKATMNVEQMKLEITTWAMTSGETEKKTFNYYYYALFLSIFLAGVYWDWMVLKLMGGLILVTSFVGWIYANAKAYFNR